MKNNLYRSVEFTGMFPANSMIYNLDIFDFTLTDDEMTEIAKLDKGVRYYNRTDEQLVAFAGWQPAYGK